MLITKLLIFALIGMIGLYATDLKAIPHIVSENWITSPQTGSDAHCPTLLAQGNTIFAAWYEGKGHGQCNKNPATHQVISSAYYREGRWSVPQKLVDVGYKCWNPVLANWHGRWLLFYKIGPDPRRWQGLMMESLDFGNSWSTPQLLPSGILGPTRSPPIVGPAGELYCGSSTESGEPDDILKSTACWIDVTTDEGKTWSKRGPIVKPNEPFGLIQPILLRIADQHLILFARDRAWRIGKEDGWIWRADSFDGGMHWTAPCPTKLPNPDKAIAMTRLSCGLLILAHNPSHTSAQVLLLSCSEDDGSTWKEWLLLEQGTGEYAYPALVETSDHRLHVLYSHTDQPNGNRAIKHVVIDQT